MMQQQQQPVTIRVGFWNTERATNPGGPRAQFVLDTLTAWIAQGPDVIILAEVTQMGRELEQALNTRFAQQGYRAEYHAVEARDGKASPCSFLVLGRTGYRAFTVGGSMRRPYVNVELPNGAIVAGIHATADQGEGALNNIIDTVNNLAKDGVAVLGDMNIPEDKNVSEELKRWPDQLTRMGWATVSPNFMTFRSKRTGREQILDYLWLNQRAWQAQNLPRLPYNFEEIDHAPIFFQIRRK
jgi:hypothetical protein